MDAEAMEFGFVPNRVVRELGEIGNWKVRADAIETLQRLVGAISDKQSLLPTLGSFVAFMLKLLGDPNFKISLTAMQVLGDLVLKTGPSLRPFLVALLPGLVGKLGDSKIVVRQATVKVLRQLHGSLGQAAVLAAMEEVYDVSSSGAAKEEIVAAVITMLPDGAGSDADVVGVMRMLSGIVKHRDGTRAVALDAFTALQDMVGASRMQALLPQLGSEGSLSEITDRLRSHSLHSDSPPRAPLVIAGAAAPVSGGLGAEVRSPPGQEERSRGIPPARGGMFGDGGEASTSSVGGRSRKAVPWEIPVPRSRGVESPVLSPTSPLSVGSSASDTAPPPLDTGQNRPPLLKTTVLGDLVESHDNQAPRRSVGHGPPGQVIKRRPSRGGVQERVQDPPDPATLLVAGRSAHAGGSSPELLGPPSRTSEIMRPLSLLKVDSGKGGAFMPLSPGGISGVGLQAPEGVSGGWGRESSFMERIQMSAARSNSERDAGVPTGRISSDVSRSGEGSEAGRHRGRVEFADSASDRHPDGGPSLSQHGILLTAKSPPVDALVKSRTGSLKSAMKAGTSQGGVPGANDPFAAHGDEGLRRSGSSSSLWGGDGSCATQSIALPPLAAESSTESILRSPLASPFSPTAPQNGLARAAGGVSSTRGMASPKPPPKRANSELRMAPSRVGDDDSSNPDTPTARSEEGAREDNRGKNDTYLFRGASSLKMSQNWGSEEKRAGPELRGGDTGARWASPAEGGGMGRNLRASLGDGTDSENKATMRGKLSILKKKQGSRRAHSANSALQRIPNSYSEGDVSASDLASSQAPFALALAHKFAPGTAAAGSTAYHDGEFDGGLTSPGGGARARGRTAASPDPSEGLSDDPFASRFNIGLGLQSGRGGESPAFPEEGGSESAAEGGGAKLVRRVSKATLQRRATKQTEAAAAAALGLPTDVSIGGGYSEPGTTGRDREFKANSSRLSGGARDETQGKGGRSISPTKQRATGEGEAARGMSPPKSSGKGGMTGRDLAAAASKPLDEILTEDLQPCAHPEREVREAVSCLARANLQRPNQGTIDWSEQYEAINVIRRAAVHHGAQLQPELKAAVVALVPSCDNLRSSLAKNALVCFQELFSFLGRAMDAHLDAVVPTLAKRAAENSAFLSAEADIALGAMIANVSDARALAALLAIAGHKTPGVRARVAAHVEACVRKMGPRCSRELLERLFSQLLMFLDEGNIETRIFGKRSLFALSRLLASSGDFEPLLKKVSNPAKLKAVREVVAANAPPALPREPGKASPLRRLSRGSTGESDAGLAHTWTSGIERGGSGKEKKRLASTAPAAVLGLGKRSPSAVLAALDGRPPGGGGNGLARSPTAGGGKEQWGEIEDPPPKARGKRGASPGRGRGGSSEGSRGVGDEVLGPVISALGGKDWRERCTGLTDLGALLDEQSPAAVEASVMAIADGLAPRMTDANSKVTLAALQICSQLLGVLSSGVGPALGVLLPALAAALGSSNDKLAAAAADTLHQLASRVDPVILVQPLTARVTHGGGRARCLLLDCLTARIHEVHARKPVLISKAVLPMALPLVGEPKGDTRTAAARLLRRLHQLMGDGLLSQCDAISKTSSERVADLLFRETDR